MPTQNGSFGEPMASFVSKCFVGKLSAVPREKRATWSICLQKKWKMLERAKGIAPYVLIL
jgi:hypothetical protein